MKNYPHKNLVTWSPSVQSDGQFLGQKALIWPYKNCVSGMKMHQKIVQKCLNGGLKKLFILTE